MPTFIKTGFWEKTQKGFDHWLNLDLFIAQAVPTPNLQQVTDVNNVTTNTINIATLELQDQVIPGQRGTLQYNNFALSFYNNNGEQTINIDGGGSNVNALGLGAGSSSTGSNINAFGEQSAQNNTGNDINAIGRRAATDNSGFNINVFGNDAGNSNSGTNVNAFGSTAAINNSGNEVNALGSKAADTNQGSGVNALGSGAAAGNTGNNVNAFGDNAATNNTSNDVNAFGKNAGLGNTMVGGNTIFSNDSLPAYANAAAGIAAITVLNGAVAGNTYLYYDIASNVVRAKRL